MKIIPLKILFFLTAAVPVLTQTPTKTEIADGTKLFNGTPVYSVEAEIVSKRVGTSDLKPASTTGESCGASDSFRINDSVQGFFESTEAKSVAYLYSDCDHRNDQRIQGVIVISNKKNRAHISYPYQADVKISRIPDIDGNSLDELAIFSSEKIGKGYRQSVRVIEFSPNGLKKFGSFELQDPKNILLAARIYVENGAPPKFYASKLQTDGYNWKNIEFQTPVELNTDQIEYVQDKGRQSLLKHLTAITFFLQTIGFIGLLGLVIYEVVTAARTSEEEKKAKLDRRAGIAKSISDDDLPKLDPINCESCGAGIPLREGEMTCPGCATRTTAPADYFDVARARGEINQKIRTAAVYLKWARFLTSGWVRYATLFLATWLVITFIALVVFLYHENFEPYQTLLPANSLSSSFLAIGSFSNCFWVVSLLFGFAIWSPNLKKALPSVEMNENLGTSENTGCPQCGGGINYEPDDLATVCGYCGVETYRARLAWKLRNLTNTIDTKANFSLIEARKAVEDAVWEVTGTPKVFAFLLIVIIVFGGLAWLISAAYDSLPTGVKDLFELIGDILSAF